MSRHLLVELVVGLTLAATLIAPVVIAWALRRWKP